MIQFNKTLLNSVPSKKKVGLKKKEVQRFQILTKKFTGALLRKLYPIKKNEIGINSDTIDNQLSIINIS